MALAVFSDAQKPSMHHDVRREASSGTDHPCETSMKFARLKISFCFQKINSNVPGRIAFGILKFGPPLSFHEFGGAQIIVGSRRCPKV